MDNQFSRLAKTYEQFFRESPTHIVSCGGRFEILGNHTDHNHGLCIASACNLEIIGAIKPNKQKVVTLKSVSFPIDEVDLTDFHPYESEQGTSKSLIRGVAAYFKENGYKVGGFSAYTESSIFKGAGVSSSAAFELFVAHIFNVLYNDGKVPTLQMCKAGQYAENVYFGKQSGLLDQISVAYGGVVKINFKDIANPEIEKVQFPFKDLHFVLINTGGDHSTMSNLYSSIPQDMFKAANEMRQRFLADCSFDELEKNKLNLTENEYLRATHFFKENVRVINAIKAMEDEDEELFLKMINESRISSTKYLKNMMVEGHYEGSPLEACDLFMEITQGKGAIKINGGGFAGSVIGVVPTEYLDKVITNLSKKYGEVNVKEIFIRTNGPLTLYKL